MAEEQKGYVQNGLFPWFCPFREHRIIPVWACDSPADTKWLLGDRDFGCLVQQNKGLGRDPKAFEETVLLASSVCLWSETGLWGKAEHWQGLVWGKKCFSVQRRLCPGRCGVVTAPWASGGAERGFGAEVSAVLYSQAGTWPFSRQGHSRVGNIRVWVSASHGLAAFVCHGE